MQGTAAPFRQGREEEEEEDMMGVADRLMFSTVSTEDGGEAVHHGIHAEHGARPEYSVHNTMAVLHSVPLFRPLANAHMQKLAEALVRSEIAAGDVVIQEGDPGDSMFIVQEGYLLASTRRHGVVKEYTAGSFFGELAIVYDEPRKATVTAAQDSVLLGIGRAAVRTLLKGDALGGALAATQEDYRLAESAASSGSISFQDDAGINQRKTTVRAHLDSVRRAVASLERVGRAADASKLRSDVDTLQEQLAALRLEGGIWDVGVRLAQGEGAVSLGARVRPCVLELDRYGRFAAWELTDSGSADHSRSPLSFCFIDQLLSVENDSELGLPPRSAAPMITSADSLDQRGKRDSLEFSTAIEDAAWGGTAGTREGSFRTRGGSGGAASRQEMGLRLAGRTSSPRALDASAAAMQFDFGDISSQRGWIYKEEQEAKLSGPSLRRKGELALSSAIGARSGGNFHRLWCEIHDGRITWWKHDPRDHESGVVNEQFAAGWLLGCTLSPPKTRRKGFPFCFRVELAQADDSGQQKYILATDSKEDFDLWFAVFTASDLSRRMNYRSVNSRLRGTIRESRDQISQAPTSIRESLRQGASRSGTETGVTLRMHEHLDGAKTLDVRFDDPEEAKELTRCMRAALHRHVTARRACVRQVQRVQQRLLKRFDGESDWDLGQLTQLWQGVYGDKPYVQGTSEFETKKPWISDGWIPMGFQNADPSTDLRGMGMLAVHCLLRLTEVHPALVSSIFSVTQERQGSYPFALAGINLCQMMIGLLRLAEVDTADLGDPDEPGPTALPCLRSPLFALFCSLPEGIDVFEAVFAALFELLERTWAQWSPDLMEFSFVLEKIRLAMVSHLARRGTLEEMDVLTVDCSNMRDEMAARIDAA